MRSRFLVTVSLLCSAHLSQAQNALDVAAYIEKYKDLAIAEQKRTGVPAAIKLAQGIHESACGMSELSKNARNHFGIKCKTQWDGATYTYSDDAKNECFRMYDDEHSSYRDHSDFLKNNKRYAVLFSYDVSDYKSWAKGLKACGYATNPKYAQRIIDLIERYDLNRYSLLAVNEYFDVGDDEALSTVAAPTLDADMIAQAFIAGMVDEANPVQAVQYYVLTEKNGLKGFYARKGDLLLNAAYANKIRYAKLLELNDLADEPLPDDMFIYLEKKKKEGRESTYTLREGETMLAVAQEQGIRLKDLLVYNHLQDNEVPEAGTVLYLRNPAPKKPLLKAPLLGSGTNDEYSKPATKSNYRVTKTTSPKASATAPPKAEPSPAVVKQESLKVENVNQVAPAAAASAPVQKEEYNIAHEPAVEVQMEAERKKNKRERAEEAQKAAQESATVAQEKPESEMSELDRLKAKLDKSVYGSNNKKTQNNNQPIVSYQGPQPKQAESANATTDVGPSSNAEVYYTRPASASSASSGNTSTEQQHAMLKRKIEAHQKNANKAEPVVANRSNTTVAAAPSQASTQRVQAASSSTQNASASYHVVKKGETAFAIAKKYGLTVNELIKLNNLPSNGTVKLGQKLKVKK